jgi:acetyl/propionyl-CoA carboxylase alpha subunit
LIEVLEPPSGPGIRLDSGIQRGTEVSYHFDPLLAKLIVWAPSRDAAIERMKRALSEYVLLGVRNNIEFLHRIVSSSDFAAGRIDTGFLDRHPELFSVDANIPVEAFLVASAIGRHDGKRQGSAPNEDSFTDVWSFGGWRNS